MTRTPQGQNALILYADFDGVLHHHNVRRTPRGRIYIDAAPPEHSVLFQHAPRLEALLAPYPQLRIVLSTSWVEVLGYSRARAKLPAPLRERVVGATYHSRMNPQDFHALPRGVQIASDVARRRPAHWLAVDDDDVGWPEATRHHLISTADNPNWGLGDPDVAQRLRRALAKLAGHEPGHKAAMRP